MDLTALVFSFTTLRGLQVLEGAKLLLFSVFRNKSATLLWKNLFNLYLTGSNCWQMSRVETWNLFWGKNQANCFFSNKRKLIFNHWQPSCWYQVQLFLSSVRLEGHYFWNMAAFGNYRQYGWRRVACKKCWPISRLML